MENILQESPAKIGAIFRRRRKELGISPERVAADANISYYRLMRVERGETDPRIGLIITLSNILKLEPAKLIDEVSHV